MPHIVGVLFAKTKSIFRERNVIYFFNYNPWSLNIYNGPSWFNCHYHIFIRFLINMQMQGHHPHQWPPLPGNWLAARIADLSPDLQMLLSWGSAVVSFHSRQSFSISFHHVILSLPCIKLYGNTFVQKGFSQNLTSWNTGWMAIIHRFERLFFLKTHFKLVRAL